MKKRSIALALCCSLVASPVWAKTFVGVLYPLFGPMAAIGLVELAGELKTMPDVEVATYLHQSWKALVDDINRQPKGTRILIVGYSLGANNAILVANNTSYNEFDYRTAAVHAHFTGKSDRQRRQNH